MSNKISQDKARAIAREYCRNGRKKAAALETIGYKHNYAVSGRGMTVYDNVLVKREIAAIDAAKEREIEITAKMCTQRFNDMYWYCVSVGDSKNAIRANENHAKHVGYYEADKDTAKTQLTINIAQQQAVIDEAIELGKALDNAPDAMAK